jgi:putative aminopeptidase FrvX
VDLGATDATLAPDAGSFAVPDQAFTTDDQQVAGKGLPDRAACAALVDLAIRTTRQDPHCIFIFYCQGQRSEHGLRLALRAFAPQAFVRLRGVRHAPTAGANGSAVLAGSGAVLVVRHNASVTHPALADACERAAAESGLLLQKAVVLSEKADLPPAETALGGVRRLELGFPVLDADCTRQRLDMRDLEALRRLLGAIAVRECNE